MAPSAEAAVGSTAGGGLAGAARLLEKRRAIVLAALGGALVLALILALSVGAVTIGAAQILAILGGSC